MCKTLTSAWSIHSSTFTTHPHTLAGATNFGHGKTFLGLHANNRGQQEDRTGAVSGEESVKNLDYNIAYIYCTYNYPTPYMGAIFIQKISKARPSYYPYAATISPFFIAFPRSLTL